MFSHEFNGEKVRVTFHYVPHEYPDGQITKDTLAKLVRLSDNKVLYTGIARQNPVDNLDYNKGRKLALLRMLKTMTENRHIRAEFWEKYFEARHGKH